MKFEIIGEISQIKPIASGFKIRDRRRLVREYGRGNWRKVKGIAIVRIESGEIFAPEIHWYEAHGIGRKEIKIKRPL